MFSGSASANVVPDVEIRRLPVAEVQSTVPPGRLLQQHQQQQQ